jgi:hypothetical protein
MSEETQKITRTPDERSAVDFELLKAKVDNLTYYLQSLQTQLNELERKFDGLAKRF